jgi:hypothetical protein
VSQQGVTDCNSNHCAIWVSPSNGNLIVVGGFANQRSNNGGASFALINLTQTLTSEPHADTHAFVNDPISTNVLYVLNDGGIYRTNDVTNAAPGNGTWSSLNSTYQTTQYYGAAGIANGFWPLIGGTQDNGTLRVSVFDEFSPSNRPATTANRITISGDGGHVAVDPTNPNYMYGEYQLMEVFRSTNGGEPDSAADMTAGLPQGGTYFGQFIAPLVMDPSNSNTLLAGADGLWRTTNASGVTPTWSSIRPPLNPGSGITAIAVAKSNSNIIWVGDGAGRLQKTSNGLQTSPPWTDVDNNTFPNPLPDRSILSILIDPANETLVYVTLGGYSAQSPSPQNVWYTSNGGSNWSPLVGSGATSLPTVPIRTIVRHPRNRQQLYVGTDIGIYESSDAGTTWSTSQQGPADVSVDELSFVQGSELLLAATHGRGLWTADTTNVPTLAPSGVAAAATTTTSINIAWNPLSGATTYQLMRSSDGNPYVDIGSPTSGTSATDGVSSGKTYLYKVRALLGGLWTDASSPDLATTILFTDDNVLAGLTVRALHLQEIRSAVNAVLVSAGMSAPYSGPSVGTTIAASDITALRNSVTTAYAKIGMPQLSFAETITAGTSKIKASHFQELRDRTK